MAKKQFTKLEMVGIAVIVIMAVTFIYRKAFYSPLSKRYKSIHHDWVKISREVGDLKLKSAGGHLKKEIRKLSTCLEEEGGKLKEAEMKLSGYEDISELETVIIQTASKCGLTVKSLNLISGDKFKDFGEDTESFYERRFCTLTLNSNFTHLRLFLEDISALPKLITVEKIDIRKEDKRKPLNTTLTLAFDLIGD